MQTGRVAAVDVGTNTVLLVIAQGNVDAPEAVLERATITRLGQGVDATRRIDEQALQRTVECLTDYGDVIRRHGVERAAGVCTSAARDAANGVDFLRRAERALGFPLRIVDGRREAELTFRGALSGLSVSGRVVVFDVGGGSTEIVVGRTGDVPNLETADSVDIGSVRLTERHLRSDPPSAAELDAVRDAVHSALAVVSPPSRPVSGIGVAGTVTTIAAVSRRLQSYDAGEVHGLRLSRHLVESTALELAALPLSQRRKVAGLDPKRADVIVAGSLIVAELMHFAALEELTVSDRGVRWGLVHELLRAPGD